MEQQVLRLLKLNFDLNDFYVITLHPNHYGHEIVLQATQSPELLFKYTNLGFAFEKDDSGFIADKDKIRIVLY